MNRNAGADEHRTEKETGQECLVLTILYCKKRETMEKFEELSESQRFYIMCDQRGMKKWDANLRNMGGFAGMASTKLHGVTPGGELIKFPK